MILKFNLLEKRIEVYLEMSCHFFNSQDSKFEIYEKEMSEVDAKELVDKHFRLLNGKSFYTNDGFLLIAKGLER